MATLKNFEFELTNNRTMVLHMMDRADKYINRIGIPLRSEGSFVQLHGPEGLPGEILQSLEQMIQQRLSRQYAPKEELVGVISVRLHDPYTIVFEIAKLWFEQHIEKIQAHIIKLMGLAEEFIELDWAQNQFLPEIDASQEEDFLD
jgi:hypothetical protein